MLRRIHAALFEAPVGSRIEVVADSQSNRGVKDARFTYAGRVLDREVILGLPGCHFDVENSRERLKAVVGFHDDAPGTARYDLSEVENGVPRSLNKFVLKSDGSSRIDFSIDPIQLAVARRGVRRIAKATAASRKAAHKQPVAKKPKPTPSRGRAKKAVRRVAKRPVRKTARAAKSRRGSSRKRR